MTRPATETACTSPDALAVNVICQMTGEHEPEGSRIGFEGARERADSTRDKQSARLGIGASTVAQNTRMRSTQPHKRRATSSHA